MLIKINIDLTHACLGNNILDVPSILINTGSVTLETTGERRPLFVMGSTYCFNEGVYKPKAMMSTTSVKMMLTFLRKRLKHYQVERLQDDERHFPSEYEAT
jgi:hypothetical protein